MENAAWLRQRHSSTYNTIEGLPWINDGITPQEAETAQYLFHIGANDHTTLEAVLALPWSLDNIISSEAKAIRYLMYISGVNERTARSLIGMPFLESVTEADALLVAGLHSAHHRGILNNFMTHQTIADGITDAETLFALAATTLPAGPHLDRLLTPGAATVESIQTSSTRTPSLTISVVRPGKRRATNTSLVIEEAINYVEASMDLPLPTNHVVVLLDDAGVSTGFAGVNYGQAITYLRQGEDGTDWERAAFRQGMVHEVAHYFWRGSEDWIDEGIADTIEYNYAIAAKFPAALTAPQKKGCSTSTLQALSNLNPTQHNPQFLCNYYLGRQFFLDLQTALGPSEFTARLQTLYQAVFSLNENDQYAGIDEVIAAFPDQPTIIAKHWTGHTPTITVAPRPAATNTPTSTPTPLGHVPSTPRPPQTATPAPGQPADTNPPPCPHGDPRADSNPDPSPNSGPTIDTIRELRLARVHSPRPQQLGRRPKSRAHHLHLPRRHTRHDNRPPPRPARFLPRRIRRRLPTGVFQTGPQLGPLHREVRQRRVHPGRQRHRHHLR